ncbi:Hypothetical protein FKW44_004834 [Caligus rogercresseyi]|uniref:Uncharacterized protein n=1 Tax=Caligus rogercresseyi TaxID=217165 RepID=A0A7T8HME8_CALRO|nr:Hypothetical protein FKW44_004834 [Caligus rogercresseyi]
MVGIPGGGHSRHMRMEYPPSQKLLTAGGYSCQCVFTPVVIPASGHSRRESFYQERMYQVG